MVPKEAFHKSPRAIHRLNNDSLQVIKDHCNISEEISLEVGIAVHFFKATAVISMDDGNS